jgi:hypothetical protein
MNEYIIELPEKIDVAGAENVSRVGVSKAKTGDIAVRNYLFRNLGRDVARVLASKLIQNGRRDRLAYLVPEIRIESGGRPTENERFYAFLNEISGGKMPTKGQSEKAGKLWGRAYGKD